LIEFLWRSVPFLSLAHDVSSGGLKRTLGEAGVWSGSPAEVDMGAIPAAAAAVLAVSPDQVPGLGWERLVRIGEVA
jgi:hypothetical protein